MLSIQVCEVNQLYTSFYIKVVQSVYASLIQFKHLNISKIRLNHRLLTSYHCYLHFMVNTYIKMILQRHKAAVCFSALK